MLHSGTNYRRREVSNDPLFCLILIPLCLSVGSFIFLSSALTGYVHERHNQKIYLNTTCFLNGTISYNEPCKDDICWWAISSGLCPSTFRLCIKTVYVIIYGNNQKAFTDIEPLWVEDDETDSICYYDKTKSGIVRWEKPNTKEFQIEILFGSLIFVASLILWIVWINLKKMNQANSLTNNDYHLLGSEL